MRTRILIAGDHQLVAEVCQNLLASKFDIVGIVNDGQALLQMAAHLKPDLVLVDIAMPALHVAIQIINSEYEKVYRLPC